MLRIYNVAVSSTQIGVLMLLFLKREKVNRSEVDALAIGTQASGGPDTQPVSRGTHNIVEHYVGLWVTANL